MGFTKRCLEDIESRGWNDSTEIICIRCLDDRALVQVVADNADPSSGACSFCGVATAQRAPLDCVVERVVEGLLVEYDDPANEASYSTRDGGYQTDTVDTRDLLEKNEVSSSLAVLGAIDRAVRNGLWCQRDLAAPPPGMGLAWSWEQFREEVRLKRRFTFLRPDPAAETDVGMFKVHQVPAAIVDAVHLARLVIDLPATRSWFRARYDEGGAQFSLATDIGSPPVQFARSNRMTPAGIGAFYGASTSDGAVGEVSKYASSGMLSIGEFSAMERLRFVDLRTPPIVPSLFDTDQRELRLATIFLRDFVESISEPTKGSSTEELAYIPTQIIAEFLRYTLPGGPVDGIIWRSTVVDGVDCCVLFVSNEECADHGAQTASTRLVLDPRTVTWQSVAT